MKHKIKNFAKVLRNYKNGWGGGPVQPWRILRANADCMYSSSLYTVFHHVIYNSVGICNSLLVLHTFSVSKEVIELQCRSFSQKYYSFCGPVR